MSFLDLNTKIDIPCPNCDRITKIKIRDLKEGYTFRCVGCRKSITIKDEGFSDGLKEAEKAISNFEKSIKQILK